MLCFLNKSGRKDLENKEIQIDFSDRWKTELEQNSL